MGCRPFGSCWSRVARYYREHPGELRQQNAALMSAIRQLEPPPPRRTIELTDAPLRLCRELARTFDQQLRRVRRRAEIPASQVVGVALAGLARERATVTEPDLHALYMATLTLRRMADGGIDDQLAGGFCRYSVDEYWMIPHFEKMLYDNGRLLAVYADAYVATGDAFYGSVAGETADWVLREMRSPEGGFYSSLDADSEGHEGKFYVWDRDEVRTALTEEEFAAFAARYGLDREPNFEGRWHLHAFRSVEEVASALDRPREERRSALRSARRSCCA